MSKKEDLYIMAAQAEAAEQVKKVEPMSISEDLCRLRRVIHQHGKHMRKLASRIDAPADMRGALSDFADTCNEVLAEVPQSECEARLSKAIDLLKDLRADYQFDLSDEWLRDIDAFLSEQPHE